MRLTKAQRAWLEKLRDEGPCGPETTGQVRVSLACKKAGWSEMVYRRPGGAIVPREPNLPPDEWRKRIPLGDRITPAGRRALEGQT